MKAFFVWIVLIVHKSISCVTMYIFIISQKITAMKDKLTNSLPQIRCSEETRAQFDRMSEDTKRTLTNILQIMTEKIAQKYKQDGRFFPFEKYF